LSFLLFREIFSDFSDPSTWLSKILEKKEEIMGRKIYDLCHSLGRNTPL
jgi:hypothetical protein